MNLAVNASLNSLNSILGDYAEIYRILPEQALAKKGSQIGFELAQRLATLKPGKGQVTAENLSALQSGTRGVKVRPGLRLKLQSRLGLANRITDKNRKRPQAVYGKALKTEFVRKGKRMNFQALAVKAELAARESGAGYSSVVARVKGLKQAGTSWASSGGGKIFSRGRYNQLLASAGLAVETDGAELTITYGSTKNGAGDALSTPRAEALIDDSVKEVVRDTMEYITDRLQRRSFQ